MVLGKFGEAVSHSYIGSLVAATTLWVIGMCTVVAHGVKV